MSKDKTEADIAKEAEQAEAEKRKQLEAQKSKKAKAKAGDDQATGEVAKKPDYEKVARVVASSLGCGLSRAKDAMDNMSETEAERVVEAVALNSISVIRRICTTAMQRAAKPKADKGTGKEIKE